MSGITKVTNGLQETVNNSVKKLENMTEPVRVKRDLIGWNIYMQFYVVFWGYAFILCTFIIEHKCQGNDFLCLQLMEYILDEGTNATTYLDGITELDLYRRVGYLGCVILQVPFPCTCSFIYALLTLNDFCIR